MNTHSLAVLGLVAIAATTLSCSSSSSTDNDPPDNPDDATLTEIAGRAANSDPLLFDTQSLQRQLDELPSAAPEPIDETDTAADVLNRLR